VGIIIIIKTDFDCWVDQFIREQFVPELLPCEFQPRLGPLGHWFDSPRWEDKKFMVVTKKIGNQNQSLVDRGWFSRKLHKLHQSSDGPSSGIWPFLPRSQDKKDTGSCNGFSRASASGVPCSNLIVVHLLNYSSPSIVQRTMTKFSWKSLERGTAPGRGTQFTLRISQYRKRVLIHFLWYWPPPQNQIYSRIWYAFSMLKLTKFPHPYGGGFKFYYKKYFLNRFIPHVYRARPTHGPWPGSKKVRIWPKIE